MIQVHPMNTKQLIGNCRYNNFVNCQGMLNKWTPIIILVPQGDKKYIEFKSKLHGKKLNESKLNETKLNGKNKYRMKKGIVSFTCNCTNLGSFRLL